MNRIAISIEGLSKQYHIGAKQESYKTLRDTLVDVAAAPLRAMRSAVGRSNGKSANGESANNAIWALKDISFNVKQGEVVGIIGRNGAGKSTLLKILSRITDPTEGNAIIHGRVGSLLEVGTGFHPELTGRENIYLNGAILGMRRVEIEKRFDEIVAFSEVGQFIDTPVKHYSSGMYLRLAFSVAAHLEPEILLVDEVLAVGDLAFQKKCLGKMEDVATQGRTVLFVSHNLGAIKEMCQKCVVLNDGIVDYHGPVIEGLARYTQNVMSQHSGDNLVRKSAWKRVYIDGKTSGLIEQISNEKSFTVGADLHLTEDFRKVRLYCIMANSDGNGILHHYINHDRFSPNGLQAGSYNIKVEFPSLWLMPDAYSLHFKLIGLTRSGVEQRYLSDNLILDMKDLSGQSHGKVRAVIIPPLEWSVSAD